MKDAIFQVVKDYVYGYIRRHWRPFMLLVWALFAFAGWMARGCF